MQPLRPVMVAVGGDSGTGKSTLVAGLYQIFGTDRIANICLDDYHSLDRVGRKKAGLTALHPDANNFALAAEHIRRLRNGETIVKPTYDHSTGTFGPEEILVPREIVVISGLHPLFTEEMRDAYDVKIWLEPQEMLKWSWKVRRDCSKRGYSIPEVISQLMERRTDQLAYIDPQKAFADLIVSFYPPANYFRAGVSVDSTDDAHLNVRLYMHPRLPRLDLDDVVALGQDSPHPSVRMMRQHGAFAGTSESETVLEIDGTVDHALAAEMDERIWSHMETHRHLRTEAIGTYHDGTRERHSDPLALTQLVIAYQVIKAGFARGFSVGTGIPGHILAGLPEELMTARGAMLD